MTIRTRVQMPRVSKCRRRIEICQFNVKFFAIANTYVGNFRGRANYPQLLISQKNRPLSLRAMSEIFEVASSVLSPAARNSFEKQSLDSISCHDLRHTCVVVRMRRYQDAGGDLGRAMERLRLFFGWSKDSQMPRLYARAYFETALAVVWNEKFDTFIDALRRVTPRGNE